MSIYSKNNTPLEYYIYAYIRLNGSPYYIGKGSKKRAWSKGKRESFKPPTNDRIVIMESNLTELGAFALERFYIRWYGRKDNNTGILRNRTDGGEGGSGIVITEAARKNMSLVKLGKTKTKEHIENIRKAKQGNKNPMFGISPWNKGKKGYSTKKKGQKRKWITNGKSSKQVYFEDLIPIGWIHGRHDNGIKGTSRKNRHL